MPDHSRKWLATKAAIGEDGVAALTDIIRNNDLFTEQNELLPVLIEAAKKDCIKKSLIAALVDSNRVSIGSPQIFGTQATVRHGTIYLLPVLNEEKVDEWRKMYDLPPLTVQIQNLEDLYAMPLLKTRLPKALAQKSKGPDISALGISTDEEEPVKVETKIVNLNVRILTELKLPAEALNFTKDDFAVVEDGVLQDVVFFSTTEKPFDLILILDFSGSTADKRKLIKKAARRFVESARAQDRIAVVAFADEIKMISDLTEDKTALADKIDDIDLHGISPIWSSMSLAYKNIVDKQSAGRRSTIVIMTDGLDSSKDTTFADLIETVRHHETTVYPVCLDIARDSAEWLDRLRRRAQVSLSMLADESGGQVYRVRDFKDLNGVYEQVVNDIGKVFSIGYEPKNDLRDGGWRNLTVKLKTRPGLIAKTRRGYYAD